jgi:hypothetical protein
MKNEAHRQIVMYICQLTVRLLYTCYLSAQHQMGYAHVICQLIVRLLYVHLSVHRQIVMYICQLTVRLLCTFVS